jgi:hypothetical protein
LSKIFMERRRAITPAYCSLNIRIIVLLGLRERTPETARGYSEELDVAGNHGHRRQFTC